MGKNIFGDLTYSSDFQFTYYHLSRDHVVRKNPNFQNNPYVYASPEAFMHFHNDLELKTMICKAGLVLCSLQDILKIAKPFFFSIMFYLFMFSQHKMKTDVVVLVTKGT